MQSTITSRGQTVIPVEIRKLFHLGPSDRLQWVVGTDGIRVTPVVANPIAAFRGSGKGGGTARLVTERRKDAKKE